MKINDIFRSGLLATVLATVTLTSASASGFLPAVPTLPQEPAARITASATLRETVLTSQTREDNDPAGVPDGALRVRARLAISGYPALEHHAWRLPSELTPKTFPNHPRFERLADGGAYAANPVLGCTCGHQNFPSWGFFNLFGTVEPDGDRVNLLAAAPCIGAYAFENEDWASAELLFERHLPSGEAMRIAIRGKRVPEDPYLYLLVMAEPADGSVRAVNLSGVPFASNPPKHAGWERWMWAMGHDWNMHAEDQTRRAVVHADSESGAFWHNRGYGESGGMGAVFLPAEVSGIRAGGTWMVGLTLDLKQPYVRLAIDEWQDFRGWRSGLAAFREALPARTARLRAMTFAWSIDDMLAAGERAEAVRYFDSKGLAATLRSEALARLQPLRDALPERKDDPLEQLLSDVLDGAPNDMTGTAAAEEARLRKQLDEATRQAEADPLQPLREALADYDAALARVRGMAVEDTPARFAAERDTLMRMQVFRDELARARSVWVRMGGPAE